MERTLTLDDLAGRSGESPAELRRWFDLGLIGRDSPDGFGHEDLERVRLIRLFLDSGIPLEHVAKSQQEGDLAGWLPEYLEARFPGAGRPAYSLNEAATKAGLDIDAARRAWEAASSGDMTEVLNEDDVAMLGTVRVALEAGLPEEALLQMLRTWRETLNRAAEVAARLFHFYVHENAEREDVERRGGPKNSRTRTGLEPLLEPAILYFLRKGLLLASPGDMVLHLNEEIGRRERGETPGQLPLAIAFVDLSSFTPLAEAMGDVKAAEILERFALLVRECVGRNDGQVVKQIGDGFMLIFHNARAAVGGTLAIEEKAAREAQFPAVRAGVHWGDVLYRDADYVGSAVNLAARVAAVADRHQVVVTAAARKEIRELPGVEFNRLGERALKGVAEPVELYAAARTGGTAPHKVVDPVCGMELGPGEIAARVSLGGEEYAFCSHECLRRLVAAPERYGG